jgi:hypothetical protein
MIPAGETGAQSTIIPSCDIVLGVLHKADVLGKMLAVRRLCSTLSCFG